MVEEVRLRLRRWEEEEGVVVVVQQVQSRGSASGEAEVVPQEDLNRDSASEEVEAAPQEDLNRGSASGEVEEEHLLRAVEESAVCWTAGAVVVRRCRQREPWEAGEVQTHGGQRQQRVSRFEAEEEEGQHRGWARPALLGQTVRAGQ